MIDLQPDLELTTTGAERILQAWLDRPVVCSAITRLKGGLVNSVFRLEFDRSPRRAVVKIHGRDGDTFAAEARALEHLGAETGCPVPGVLLHDSSAHLVPFSFLLLEHVPGVCLDGLDLEPDDRVDIEIQLAGVLGELHGHRGRRWGSLDSDDAPQSWGDLFASRLAEARADAAVGRRLTSDVLALVDDSIDRARTALRDAGPPTLVHGDVWDGNLMVHRADDRWLLSGLLDPNLQFADVESELAYLEVFDTPRDSFFAAYTEHHTLRPGYERRRLFYWLHTALVHVALFGDEFFCDYTARTAAEIVRSQVR